ncbi:MAG: aminotransferase class III-fold pyridoxal phosphate-dependent enzyme [Rhodospirillaceae bacterium]|jgi:4-aminobutyrate aminotransferase-like enzyme/Ser/Thr protein kinase RdoA (MazF antagonist)|nr:aminotransferase class III-fold pyridoxal phosphate-dependent enzyme [Rhodospirillaceae bacterium]MBT6203673.1 aminotransferase class III-fold pyridoxal phosphate-dependent enzyme [Rhodospirillaceae bacterium]MBT6513016.1 aminotransferase class III-fold pyridoxal phosphate-dependent enzyme [Rhodospirillaceae bacterium]
MNDTSGDIKFLISDTPDFPEDQVHRIARRLFGIDGELKFLDSDRDLNFRLRNGDGTWVLKFFHPEEDEGVIDFQTKALVHIAQTDPDMLVPKVVPTKRGLPFGRAKAPDGRTSIVRLLGWVPGTDLHLVEDNRNLRHSTGALVARLDKALQGFYHPSALHTLVWDIKQSPALRIHTGDIKNRNRRRLCEKALDGFIDHVLPRWTHLRGQVIHNDANMANVVVDPAKPDTAAGVIDFGDMIYGPIAAEVAMAADGFGFEVDDTMNAFIDVALGFDSVMPLMEDEVEVLFDMIAARFALTATIVARRAVARTGSPDYQPGLEKTSTDALDKILTVGREAGTAMFRDALRFPARSAKGTVSTPEATDLKAQLKRRNKYLGKHLSLFYKKPLHVERGEGAILYDANGRAFVDAYNNVTSVGHCHPHVVNAITRQASALGTNTRYVYSILAEYAERLQGTMPSHLNACVLVNSGSEANDIAWQMSTMLTGKRGGIVMHEAYHGITEAIAALSPVTPENIGHGAGGHVAQLTPPDTYRGPWRKGEKGLADKYAADADRAIAELDQAGFGTACFMIDTSFCSDGIPDVPKGYLKKVAAKVRAAGGMIIGDEVQYGFGRPGTHMWGFEYHGMKPDIVTIGKPVGDGFPLGVVVTSREILNAFTEATGLFSTFGGNPVACAAGLAVLDVIENENLLEHCRITSEHMKAGLRELMERHECIGDVRGHGFVTGVEIVSNRETRTPDADTMVAIMNRMRELGVLTGREGHDGNVFKIRPPMVFSRDNADTLITAMDQAMSEM